MHRRSLTTNECDDITSDSCYRHVILDRHVSPSFLVLMFGCNGRQPLTVIDVEGSFFYGAQYPFLSLVIIVCLSMICINRVIDWRFLRIRRASGNCLHTIESTYFSLENNVFQRKF
jgi:hypothetical protein